MSETNEVVYSTPKVIHYEGCGALSDYPCDCYSMTTEDLKENYE